VGITLTFTRRFELNVLLLDAQHVLGLLDLFKVDLLLGFLSRDRHFDNTVYPLTHEFKACLFCHSLCRVFKMLSRLICRLHIQRSDGRVFVFVKQGPKLVQNLAAANFKFRFLHLLIYLGGTHVRFLNLTLLALAWYRRVKTPSTRYFVLQSASRGVYK